MTDTAKVIPLDELVVPRHYSTLYRLVNAQLEEVCKLEDYPYSKYVIGGNRWIVAIRHDLNTIPIFLDKNKQNSYRIYRAKVNDDGSVTQLPDVVLPSHFLDGSLAIKGDVVYLGGNEVVKQGKDNYKSTGEQAGFLNLALEEPVWRPLPLPDAIGSFSTVGEVLLDGDKLVVVDSKQEPKLLVEYDISEPLAPTPSLVKRLVEIDKNNPLSFISSMELNLSKFMPQGVIGGRFHENWLALKNQEKNNYSSSNCITLYSLPDYTPFFKVNLDIVIRRRRSEYTDPIEYDSFTTLADELERARNQVELNDFAIAGDHLVLSCGFHGLALFNLPELLQEFVEAEEERVTAEKGWENGFQVKTRATRYYNLQQLSHDKTRKRQIEGMSEVGAITVLKNGGVIVWGHGETFKDERLEVINL